MEIHVYKIFYYTVEVGVRDRFFNSCHRIAFSYNTLRVDNGCNQLNCSLCPGYYKLIQIIKSIPKSLWVLDALGGVNSETMKDYLLKELNNVSV